MTAPKNPEGHVKRRSRAGDRRIRREAERIVRDFPNLKRAEQAATVGCTTQTILVTARRLGLFRKGGRPRKGDE